MNAESKTIHFWNSRFFNRIIIFALIALVCFLLFKSCDQSKEINRVKTNNEILKDSVAYSESKLGQEIASKRALEVSYNELKASFWIKDDSLKDITRRFKKVKSTTIIKTVYQIDTVEVRFEVPVDYKFSRSWAKNTSYYSITGLVTDKGITIDKLSLRNTQRLVIGTKKGFFNNQLSIEVTNSNPYVKTKDILTQSVTVPNKRFGVGFFAGIDILGKPTLGVGLNYSLFRF